ncbi:hypothetical protein Lser_V15G01583 [Lactuca serriola]
MSSPSPLHPHYPATQNLEVTQWRNERYYRRRVPSTNATEDRHHHRLLLSPTSTLNWRVSPISTLNRRLILFTFSSLSMLLIWSSPSKSKRESSFLAPYITPEAPLKGFPVWLKYVPGISFITDNEPFKAAMQGFIQKIVGMLKAENLFESQGGPIILSQIENEYGAQGKSFGAAGKAYINWAAKMAVELNTGVPMRSHQP